MSFVDQLKDTAIRNIRGAIMAPLHIEREAVMVDFQKDRESHLGKTFDTPMGKIEITGPIIPHYFRAAGNTEPSGNTEFKPREADGMAVVVKFDEKEYRVELFGDGSLQRVEELKFVINHAKNGAPAFDCTEIFSRAEKEFEKVPSADVAKVVNAAMHALKELQPERSFGERVQNLAESIVDQGR